MSEVLGIEPDPVPEPPAPDVARDIQRDAVQVALHDIWFHGVMGVACMAGAAAMTWIERGSLGGFAGPTPSWLGWQLGIFALFAFASAIDAWRAHLRMRDGDAATVPERHWVGRRSRHILLILLLIALGYQLYTRRVGVTGPIVFRHASITTSTGFVQEGMTVAVAGGRIVFVGFANESIPLSLSGARQIDAMSALVSAATFDHAVASPPQALRHTWVGQIFVGAPGDLIISSYTPSRGRRTVPQPRDFRGAVMNGRYYTASELK